MVFEKKTKGNKDDPFNRRTQFSIEKFTESTLNQLRVKSIDFSVVFSDSSSSSLPFPLLIKFIYFFNTTPSLLQTSIVTSLGISTDSKESRGFYGTDFATDVTKFGDANEKLEYYVPDPESREKIGRIVTNLSKFAIRSAVNELKGVTGHSIYLSIFFLNLSVVFLVN